MLWVCIFTLWDAYTSLSFVPYQSSSLRRNFLHVFSCVRSSLSLFLPLSAHACVWAGGTETLGIEPGVSALHYIPIYETVSHQVPKLSKLGSNFESSCINLSECWDYKCGAPSPACLYFYPDNSSSSTNLKAIFQKTLERSLFLSLG